MELGVWFRLLALLTVCFAYYVARRSCAKRHTYAKVRVLLKMTMRCAACCSILRLFRIGQPLDLIPWVEFFKPILFRFQKIRGRSTRTVFRHKNDYYDCIGVVVAHQVCVRSMCSAFLCFFPHWNGKEITAAGWRLGSVYLQITAHFG